MRSMRFGLMVPGFNPNDAVGNDVLGMYMALQGRGIEPTIFTSSGESSSFIPVMHYADVALLLAEPDDVLVCHYCGADPVALAIIRCLCCRVILRYHNVTPAYMMSRYSLEFSRACRVGREMLMTLPDLPIDAFISDSDFNAKEIVNLGVAPERSYVVPPIHRIEELVSQPDSTEIRQLLDQNALNVLAVGRLVPNKSVDVMISSFAEALDANVIDFHLHLVGLRDSRLQRYVDLLEEILVAHGVSHKCTFHGVLSLRSLATLYRHCNVFWTTSLHEGFGVTAVEAMAFALPILSSVHAALPETCGDAALYGSSTSDFAEKLIGLLTNDETRYKLGKRGRQRYETHFRGSALKRRFLETIDEILRSSKEPVPALSLHYDGYWFELPDAPRLIKAALAVSKPLPVGILQGRDRRADFIDWILSIGWSLSPEISGYLREQAFLDYVSDLELPTHATHLGISERLVWKFHRAANSRFDLKAIESVADYLRWYVREAAGLYIDLAAMS